jgi:hypothetical protein
VPWNREAFLKNWRAALVEASEQRRFFHEGWQGPIAYRQLKKLGLLEVIRFNPGERFAGYRGWRLGHDFREFGYVVDTYHEAADILNEQKKRLMQQVDFLKSADTALRDVLRKSIPTELKRSIRTTKLLLKREISARTAEIEDQVWNSELLLWRPALRKLTGTADRDRNFELESKFQIRIAFLLLRYIHAAAPKAAKELPFADISRLVMLFYLGAELAEKDSESLDLRCLRTGKLLSQKTIDQNLTRAGLNRMDFRLSSLARTRGSASG